MLPLYYTADLPIHTHGRELEYLVSLKSKHRYIDSFWLEFHQSSYIENTLLSMKDEKL